MRLRLQYSIQKPPCFYPDAQFEVTFPLKSSKITRVIRFVLKELAAISTLPFLMFWVAKTAKIGVVKFQADQIKLSETIYALTIGSIFKK